jgi:chromosome segregation ATPase
LGLTLASTVFLAQWLRTASRLRRCRKQLHDDTQQLSRRLVEVRAERDQAQADMKQLPDAVEALHSSSDERDQAQRDLIGKLRVELEVETRKSAEYFKKISDACGEREFWRRWYYNQSAEHSSAQSYLLGRYEQLAAQFKRDTGKMPKLDPITKELVEQFRDTHPALAEAGRDADDKDRSPPAVEAPSGESAGTGAPGGVA